MASVVFTHLSTNPLQLETSQCYTGWGRFYNSKNWKVFKNACTVWQYLRLLSPPIKPEPPSGLSTLTHKGPQLWLLKTNTPVFNINPSFYVPAFIRRSCKPSDKQSGTVWLQAMHCKEMIKRRQEKKSSECCSGGPSPSPRWPVMFAGVVQPDNLYAAQTGRMLFKEHCKS